MKSGLSHSEMVPGYKKEQVTDARRSMGGSQKHHGEWKKPDTEECKFMHHLHETVDWAKLIHGEKNS